MYSSDMQPKADAPIRPALVYSLPYHNFHMILFLTPVRADTVTRYSLSVYLHKPNPLFGMARILYLDIDIRAPVMPFDFYGFQLCRKAGLDMQPVKIRSYS